MNPKQKRKLIAIIGLLILLAAAATLILYALKQNINLFYTPTQLLQAQYHPDQTVRIGGYVKKHSVEYDRTGQNMTFIVSDNINQLTVHYQGVLPNLFREGQGIVATGKLSDQHIFVAEQILAKHDEKYMPPVLAKQLTPEKQP